MESTGQSDEVRAYLRYKMEGCDFNMCIDPDKGYIPFCEVCRGIYEKYKGEETCDMEHSDACLWYAYFWSKIRDINPAVTVKRAFAPSSKAPASRAPPAKAPVRVPSKPPVKPQGK